MCLQAVRRLAPGRGRTGQGPPKDFVPVSRRGSLLPDMSPAERAFLLGGGAVEEQDQDGEELGQGNEQAEATRRPSDLHWRSR